ncbi:hypothetical protein LDENG_00101790 [Lucifuga dentata]|nr:hypothetical protein LDENG_00101790 [Lucifuga dentata]
MLSVLVSIVFLVNLNHQVYEPCPSPRHYKNSAVAEVVQSQHLHHKTIMKVATLALALLLAVGSQAASVQSEAPAELQQVRSVVAIYLNQVKDSLKKAVDNLEGTEYSKYKTQLDNGLENLSQQLQALQAQASPYTDAFSVQFKEYTAAIRESISADIDSLKTELEPKHEALKAIIEKHIEDYRAKMEPIIREYTDLHKAEMEKMKVKLEPMVEELRTKVVTNVEETKAALMPIVDSVRAKITERLESLKDIVSPYVEEYKGIMKQVIQQAKEKATSLSPEEIQAKVTELKTKAEPIAEDLKTKFIALYNTIFSVFADN